MAGALGSVDVRVAPTPLAAAKLMTEVRPDVLVINGLETWQCEWFAASGPIAGRAPSSSDRGPGARQMNGWMQPGSRTRLRRGCASRMSGAEPGEQRHVERWPTP